MGHGAGYLPQNMKDINATKCAKTKIRKTPVMIIVLQQK